MRRGVSQPDPDLGEVLRDLADEDCRELIRAMDEPSDAGELAERTEVPVSTTYRKLDGLADATLVDERIDIRDDGRHTSMYVPDFDRVVISLTEDRELELDIVRPARSGDERLEELWTEVRRGV